MGCGLVPRGELLQAPSPALVTAHVRPSAAPARSGGLGAGHGHSPPGAQGSSRTRAEPGFTSSRPATSKNGVQTVGALVWRVTHSTAAPHSLYAAGTRPSSDHHLAPAHGSPDIWPRAWRWGTSGQGRGARARGGAAPSRPGTRPRRRPRVSDQRIPGMRRLRSLAPEGAGVRGGGAGPTRQVSRGAARAPLVALETRGPPRPTRPLTGCPLRAGVAACGPPCPSRLQEQGGRMVPTARRLRGPLPQESPPAPKGRGSGARRRLAQRGRRSRPSAATVGLSSRPSVRCDTESASLPRSLGLTPNAPELDVSQAGVRAYAARGA